MVEIFGFIRTIRIYLFGFSVPKKREGKPRRVMETYPNFELSDYDEQLMKNHNMVRKENKPTIPTPVSIQSTPVQPAPTTIVNVSTPAIVVPTPEPTITKPIIIATPTPPPPTAISNPPAKKPIIIANKKDTKLDNQSKGIINNALPKNNTKNKPKNDDNKNVRNNATNTGNAPKKSSGSKSNTDNAKKTGNTSNTNKPKKNVRFTDSTTKHK